MLGLAPESCGGASESLGVPKFEFHLSLQPPPHTHTQGLSFPVSAYGLGTLWSSRHSSFFPPAVWGG